PRDRESGAAGARATERAATGWDSLGAVGREVVRAAECGGARPPRDVAIDGWPLLAVHGKAQARSIWVVQQAHVGPVVAVAHLHTKRIEHPVAAGRYPELPAGGHQPVPHLAGPGLVDVQLPAQLADIRHALS